MSVLDAIALMLAAVGITAVITILFVGSVALVLGTNVWDAMCGNVGDE